MNMSISTLKAAVTTIQRQGNVERSDEDLRLALEAIDELAKALGKQRDNLRTEAVKRDLASYDVTYRETSPGKALYIELHGQHAFDMHKRQVEVKRFTWR
jgi:hypothetical protein